jgi:hypothetical protein
LVSTPDMIRLSVTVDSDAGRGAPGDVPDVIPAI